MSSALIAQWKQGISKDENYLKAHPYQFEVGQYMNMSSSYNQRKQKEDEILDLRKRVKLEEERQIKTVHHTQDKELTDKGIVAIGDDKTDWQKFTDGLGDLADITTRPVTNVMNAFTPTIDRGLDSVDNVVNKTGEVVTHGEDAIGNVLSGPLIWIGGGVALFVVYKSGVLKKII